MLIRANQLFQLGILILFYTLASNSFAISIDEFSGTQTTISADGKTSSQASVSGLRNDILGSFRTIEVGYFSGDLGVRAGVVNGKFSHSQDSETRGFSNIIWDGNNSVSSINFNGLNNLNLLQDGATAFRLGVASFDYPFGTELKLIFKVYDGGDQSGQTFSEAEVILDRQMLDETIEIPFSNFTNQDPSRLARFTHVGAISLHINGADPDIDLRLDFINTNGSCNLIPVDGIVIDQCGVCGGDNSSCKDCQGVPNGSLIPGSSCATGKLGVCAFGVVSTQCICESLNASAEVCDAQDNDCDGLVDEIESVQDLQTCYDCDVFDQFDRLRRLDGGAKAQEYIIKQALNELRRYKKDKVTKIYINKARIKAHELQTRNWILSWSLPVTVIQCPDNAQCETVSNVPILEEYKKHSEELLELAYDVVSRLQSIGRKSQKMAKYARRRSDFLHKNNLDRLATVPIAQSKC